MSFSFAKLHLYSYGTPVHALAEAEPFMGSRMNHRE